MNDMTQIAEHSPSERDKVAGWRLHVLMEAGYPLPLAERLAQSDADLHSAVELIRQGCEPKTAAEILLSPDPRRPLGHLHTQGGEHVPPATRGERIRHSRTRLRRNRDKSHRSGGPGDRPAERAEPRA